MENQCIMHILSNFDDTSLASLDNSTIALELLLYIQQSIKNNQWELLNSKRLRGLSLGDALIANKSEYNETSLSNLF